MTKPKKYYKIYNINTDDDYINCPSYKNSIIYFLQHNNETVTDEMICQLLCLTKEQFDILYTEALNFLKIQLSKYTDGDI